MKEENKNGVIMNDLYSNIMSIKNSNIYYESMRIIIVLDDFGFICFFTIASS
jgi:hypothetical protein